MSHEHAPLSRNQSRHGSLWNLFRRIHHNECGAVSLETILIIGAIALPILIFILKFGWPRVREYFTENTDHLSTETSKITSGN